MAETLKPLNRPLSVQEIDAMKAAWEAVPPVTACKGLCFDSCTNVPINPVEAYYLIERHGAQIVKTVHPANDPENPAAISMPTLGPDYTPCRFLTAERRCSIYEERPLVCRMFGHHALTLRCVHGCGRTGDFMDYDAAETMLKMIQAFDGFHVNDGEDVWGAMKRTFDEMETEP
jgi:Fe-S-cluster containining protein